MNRHLGRRYDHILLLGLHVARVMNRSGRLVVIEGIGCGTDILQVGLNLTFTGGFGMDFAVLLVVRMPLSAPP